MSSGTPLYLYGKNPLVEALHKVISGKNLLGEVFLTKQAEQDPHIMSLLQKAKVSYSKVTTEEIEHKVGRGVVHQGVCALVHREALYTSLERVLDDTTITNPCVILLDELEDPHNVGAIIRSAVAFGAHAILVPEHSQAEVNGTVIKSSVGTTFSIPLVHIGNVHNMLRTLKEKGFWVYGLTGSGSTSLHNVSFDAPTVIIIGSEGKGIREKTLTYCDFSLSIPISDKCESLNASNAVAVTLYEWNKQRGVA
ncbi:MAG: hypothetical protein RLZZ308_722 [Candidatus Parcubacteria bacterium]|jgi:23S rRNA (guanosine2251-2'-O)-methyltransferase